MADRKAKKNFEQTAKPLTAKEQVALTAQLAIELAKACPDAGSVSAQVGGIKITLKQKQPK